MDLWTWMMSLGIIGILIGGIGIAVWRGWILSEIGEMGKMVALFTGIAFLVAGMTGLGWLGFETTQEQVPTTFNGAYDVTATENLGHIVPISGADAYEVRVTYNTTSNAIALNTEFIVINFTIERSDLNLEDEFTYCEVTDIGSYTANTGINAGETKALISTNAAGNYEITWSKNSGDSTGYLSETDERTNFPREKNHRDGWCNVNITISPTCLESMSADGTGTTSSFTLSVAGNPYSFYVRYNAELT